MKFIVSFFVRIAAAVSLAVSPVVFAGECLLCSPAKKGDITEVKRLLAASANPNAADDFGSTALMEATQKGYDDVVKILLLAGANADAVDNGGVTALMVAARQGNAEVVKILLSAGADVDAVHDNGWTALRFAKVYRSSHKSPEIIRMLEEASTPVQKSKRKTSPSSSAQKPAKKLRVVEKDKKITKMPFNQCLFTMDGMLANLGVENADTIVDTDIFKVVKVPTYDGSVIISCSKLDENMVVARFEHN